VSGHVGESVGRQFACRECRTIVYEAHLLTAPHPFIEDEIVAGCPACKEIDCFSLVCDEPDCERTVSCGTPTPSGYRQTCGEHKPKVFVSPTPPAEQDANGATT
jgi:hypothetical protein